MDQDAIDLALLVFRCAVMVAHGDNNVFGGGEIQGTAGWFAGTST